MSPRSWQDAPDNAPRNRRHYTPQRNQHQPEHPHIRAGEEAGRSFVVVHSAHPNTTYSRRTRGSRGDELIHPRTTIAPRIGMAAKRYSGVVIALIAVGT